VKRGCTSEICDWGLQRLKKSWMEYCCDCLMACSLDVPPYKPEDCMLIAGRGFSRDDWEAACAGEAPTLGKCEDGCERVPTPPGTQQCIASCHDWCVSSDDPQTRIGPAGGVYFMSCCIAKLTCKKLARGWLPGIAGRIKDAVKHICDNWDTLYPGRPKPSWCEKIDQLSPERMCDLIDLVCPETGLE